MPIRGLTDRGAAFPEIGRIRKGAKKEKNRPGKDLEYFRVEFDEFEVEAIEAFREIYGDEPRLLRIVLPLPTHIETDGDVHNPNWDAWREAYLAGGMIHRCDGERVWYHINPLTGEHEVRSGEPETLCPCATSKDDKTPIGHYLNKKEKKVPVYCGFIGRMQVILPELDRFAYLTLLTHSFYDIVNLSRQMNGYIQVHGNLQGIPFIIQRKPKEIPAPIGEGGRKVRVTKWMLSIETDPEWVKAKLEAMRTAATPQLPASAPALPAPVEEGEFREVPQEEDPPEEPEETLAERIEEAEEGDVVVVLPEEGSKEPPVQSGDRQENQWEQDVLEKIEELQLTSARRYTVNILKLSPFVDVPYGELKVLDAVAYFVGWLEVKRNNARMKTDDRIPIVHEGWADEAIRAEWIAKALDLLGDGVPF